MRRPLFAVALIFLTFEGCNRKNAAFADCFRNNLGSHMICTDEIDPKSKIIKIVEVGSRDVLYERLFSNGGNAKWISSKLVEFEAFSGHSDAVGKFFFDVHKGRVLTEAEMVKN